MVKLQRIQNSALRVIYKLPFDTPIEVLHETAKIERLNERLDKLNNNYLLKAILNNNELVLELLNEYGYDYINRQGENPTILCAYKDLFC